MHDDALLQKICDDVQREWQMGGLSDGLYGDYAKEVAKRYAARPEAGYREALKELLTAQRDYERINAISVGEKVHAARERLWDAQEEARHLLSECGPQSRSET